MADPSYEARIRGLAATYDTEERAGWTLVEEYNRFRRAVSGRDSSSREALAAEADLPVERVNRWLDKEQRPPVVTALDHAGEAGWLTTQPHHRQFEALSILHAWVTVAGSIHSGFGLRLSAPDSDVLALLERATAELGFEIAERPEGNLYRVNGANTTYLGRFLAGALDAPAMEEGTSPTVPEWLREAPVGTRARWCQTVVALRGQFTRQDALRVVDSTHDAFLRGFAELAGGLVDDTDAVSVTDDRVLIEGRAAAFLHVVPRLPREPT